MYNNSDRKDDPEYHPGWDNYWLKQQYELAPYYAFRALTLEAEKQHFNWRVRDKHQKTWTLLYRSMNFLGFCLATWGEQLQKRYGIDFRVANPIHSINRNASHEWRKSGADKTNRL